MADKFDLRNYYNDIKRLFDDGPVVRHRIASKVAAPGQTGVPIGTAKAFLKHVNNAYASAVASYGQYSRLARYCVSGDTLIPTPGPEEHMSMEEVVERFEKGEELYTFAYDKENNKMVCVPIAKAWKTKTDEIWEVEFDDGTILKCTRDHRIMLRDGSYKEAQDLSAGEAVMPFNRKKFAWGKTKGKIGYRFIYSKSRWTPEHKIVAECLIGKIRGDEEVHHVDFNAANNVVDNLKIMNRRNHRSFHAKINNKRFSDPAERERQSQIAKKRWEKGGDLRENIKEITEKRLNSEGWKKQVERLKEYNKVYKPGKHNKGRQDQKGLDNANADVGFSFQDVCSAYSPGMSVAVLAEKLNCSIGKIRNRLKWEGYKSYTDFRQNYRNHKVVGVRATGKYEDVYDLTIDKYHNFAAGSSVSPGNYVIISNSDYNEMECVHSTTLVHTVAHGLVRIDKLCEMYKDPDARFEVYSYDIEKGEVVIGKAFYPRLTKLDRTFKVNFDGGFLVANSTHPFLMEDGKYKPLKELKPGDLLRKNEGSCVKVKSIVEYDDSCVYDLSVEKYNNFCVSGFIDGETIFVHNSMAEIGGALSIYAEEVCVEDEFGEIIKIDSSDMDIKKALYSLFYDVLNIQHNASVWVRNLCKYGDQFLLVDHHPDYGVLNLLPVPVNEIEREEGYDENNPMSYRYRWINQGNRILENWQIIHFRMMENDNFLPYGSAVLEPARRVWRQLILMEDAVMVYRIVRSPERRVFYIDVGNVAPKDIPGFMNNIQTQLKRNQVVDNTTGRVDARYNPMSTDEDYFIPIRGEHSSRIESLPGGQFTGDIDDLVYIQNKLFAALKIPKSYLGYEQDISAKATLSQEDVRFAKTIKKIQNVFIAELNKVAIIHLHSMGYKDDELINFNLSMTNPSTVAELQRLELWRSKFEVASLAQEGMLDRNFIYTKLFNMSDADIEAIEIGKRKDRLYDMELESMQAPMGAMPPAEEVPPEGEVPPEAGSPPAPGGAGGEEAGLPPPPGEEGEAPITAARDPNKQIAAPNELVKVKKPRKKKRLTPDLYKHAFNIKKTAMDPKRNYSELGRFAKAPFGEGTESEGKLKSEEVYFRNSAAKLKKFAEDLEKVEVLSLSSKKNTKKVISG